MGLKMNLFGKLPSYLLSCASNYMADTKCTSQFLHNNLTKLLLVFADDFFKLTGVNIVLTL